RRIVAEMRTAGVPRAGAEDEEADFAPDAVAEEEAAPVIQHETDEIEVATADNVTELPFLDLPEPEPEAELEAESAGGSEPRPTLFQRLLNRSRPPKEEPKTVETLAPEPEEPEEQRDDPTVIPPFFRRQSN
ncbi:MAG: hypothetical protein ACK4TG_09060, partial [Thermaurantiacus sp.]